MALLRERNRQKFTKRCRQTRQKQQWAEPAPYDPSCMGPLVDQSTLWAAPAPYDPSCMGSQVDRSSLWAEPAPYDPSCMGSTGDQTLSLEAQTPEPPPRRQTPAHQRILGHLNNYDTHHHHPEPPTNPTPPTPFTDITLSPITHKNDHTPTHMIEPQPMTQNIHMNDSHDIIHTWIRKHTQHIINNTTLSTFTQSHMYESLTLHTLHSHSTSTQSHMNESSTLQKNPHSHNTSRSFTYMNDTYLVVHDQTQNNSFE